VQPVVFEQGANGELLAAGEALHTPPSSLPQVIGTRDGGATWTTLPALTTAPGTNPTITLLSDENLALLSDSASRKSSNGPAPNPTLIGAPPYGTVFASTIVTQGSGAPRPILWILEPG